MSRLDGRRMVGNGKDTQSEGMMAVDATQPVTVQLVPLARLRPASWNPRTIREPRFKNLCQSIQADPDFLWRRPVLALADGTVYAGNMRLRAAQHLGWKDVPAIVEDVPEQLAKERALRDNRGWGDDDDQALAELLYELKEMGTPLDLLGFEDGEVERLLASVSGPVVPIPSDQEEPRLASERLIEIYCSGDDVTAFQPVLTEWGQRRGVTVNIS